MRDDRVARSPYPLFNYILHLRLCSIQLYLLLVCHWKNFSDLDHWNPIGGQWMKNYLLQIMIWFILLDKTKHSQKHIHINNFSQKTLWFIKWLVGAVPILLVFRSVCWGFGLFFFLSKVKEMVNVKSRNYSKVLLLKMLLCLSVIEASNSSSWFSFSAKH